MQSVRSLFARLLVVCGSGCLRSFCPQDIEITRVKSFDSRVWQPKPKWVIEAGALSLSNAQFASLSATAGQCVRFALCARIRVAILTTTPLSLGVPTDVPGAGAVDGSVHGSSCKLDVHRFATV